MSTKRKHVQVEEEERNEVAVVPPPSSAVVGGLETIPKEPLDNILSFLNWTDGMRFAQTCHGYYSTLTFPFLWKQCGRNDHKDKAQGLIYDRMKHGGLPMSVLRYLLNEYDFFQRELKDMIIHAVHFYPCRDMEDVLINEFAVEYNLSNCGHCTRTDRAAVKKCWRPGNDCRKSRDGEYVCQACLQDRFCRVCNKYGKLNCMMLICNMFLSDAGMVLGLSDSRIHLHQSAENVCGFNGVV
jgi:hypothetical protein